MATQRWDPRRDLLQLRDRVDRLFGECLARSSGALDPEPQAGTDWRPAVDVLEQRERYVVRVDVPGTDTSAVHVNVEEGDLVVRGERRLESAASPESYLRMERPHGSFLVRIALPDSVDREAVAAAQRNGVLEVILPKRRSEGPARIRVAVS